MRTVSVIGIGAGDPRQITMQAIDALNTVDVVFMIDKGAQNPRLEKVGSVTKAQLRQIAETKMPDLNSVDLDGATAQIAGTARSMGIEVAD